MPTALTDADKVIRNDTGKEIAAAIRDLAAPEADKVAYDNTSSGLSADNAQDAIDELASEKMEKFNPTGTGSLSLNRKANTTIGNQSVAVGYNCEASGVRSFSEGANNISSGNYSHSEGYQATASLDMAHAEGNGTTASGTYSHAQGWGTIANHRGQTALGEYNTEDPSTAAAYSRGNYIEIVGNGSNDANRSNARTLDWNGNETLAGDLKINGNQSLSTLWTTLSGLTVLSEKSGSIASFSTDIADKLFSCYVNVTAVQAGSGTPSPSNVRSISGWSACNFSQTGKNIWNKNSGNVINGYLGGSTISSGSLTRTVFVSCNPNTTYTISKTAGQRFAVAYTEELPALGVAFYGTITKNTNSSITITTSATAKYIVAYVWHGEYDTGITDTAMIASVQIEVGSTATAYQAFGTTHNIPFNTTVYGGVLDVLSGVLTVTFGIVDLGTLDWGYDATYVVFTSSQVTNMKYTQGVNNIVCSAYQTSPNQTSVLAPDLSIYVRRTANGIVGFGLKNSNYTSGSDLKTALNGTKCIFELENYSTIQLTPTEVKTILGQNNIFGDCGDIDLKYLETIGNRLT